MKNNSFLSMVTAEKRLQIRSNSLIEYTRFTGTHFRTQAQQKSIEKLLTGKTYTGQVKDGSAKRLGKAIEHLVATFKKDNQYVYNTATGKMMPFRLAFTTLTIHDTCKNISGREAYKNLLSPFLQWLRRQQGCNTYIWKAELQERGQIHYHLLLAKFVDMNDIRAKWNYLCKKHGYLDAFYKEFGHYNAPSTEIKNTIEDEEQKRDLAGYLKKEVLKRIQSISKETLRKDAALLKQHVPEFSYYECIQIANDVDSNESVHGKVWDCSMNLKEFGYFEVNADEYQGTIKQLARAGMMAVGFANENCTVYKMLDCKFKDFLMYSDSTGYKEHLKKIKDFNIEERRQKQRLERLEREHYWSVIDEYESEFTVINVADYGFEPESEPEYEVTFTKRAVQLDIFNNKTILWNDVVIDNGLFLSS